jgi:hypothetical protein
VTGSEIINSSLRIIGALATSEVPSAGEANDALNSLNDMIDSWSNENLMAYTKVREVFPLVSGQQTYTMGAGGNFNTSRAQRIENALIQPPNMSTALEIPMKILNKDQYAGILIKPLQSTFPLYIYAEGAYPLDNINVWPVPNTTCNIALYSWKTINNLTLTTTLSLPPGYQRALRYNLAVDLAQEYGRMLSEDVKAIAIESKSVLKRKNTTPSYLRVDESLQSKSAVWNWMTGEPE